MKRTIINRENLTQCILKKLITYNPDTGIITRKKLDYDMRVYFHPGNFTQWNQDAGKQLGVINTHTKRNNYQTVQLSIFGVNYTASRLIWLYMTGDWPEHHIDHINGNSIDNRWCNLRDITCQENLRNQKIRKNNRSGKAGVYWCNTKKRWIAKGSVVENGKNQAKHLGAFHSLEDAIKARCEWEESQGDFTERHSQIKPKAANQMKR